MKLQANATGFAPLDPDFAARCRDSFARQGMMKHLGAVLAVIEPGYCEIHLENRPEIRQQHGYVHGGALATIIDSAAGYAAFSLMPPTASILTVEYKLNILRPGEGERMVARGRVIKPGRSLSVVNADAFAVKDGVETMCVTSIHTLMAMHGKPDAPRGR